VSSSHINDVGKYFPDLYAYGREAFPDHELSRRSWTLSFFDVTEP
jgi:hypothetical protein